MEWWQGDRPPVDVVALGGWAGPRVMQQVYQRATVEEAESALLAGDPGRGVREASGDDG